MEFNIRKPEHILGLIILLAVFTILFIEPVLSYVGINILPNIVEFKSITIIGAVFTLLLFVATPIIWYTLVNKYSLKEIFQALKLTHGKIDRAFLWGIVAASIMFIITALIGVALTYIQGIDPGSITDINEIVADLSIITILIITIQLIGAEIFFRGFLLEKIDEYAGKNIAIIITSLLFGIIYLSFGDYFPAIIPIFLGFVLGYFVIKTKNLYTAITAQIFFSAISIILTIVVKTFIAVNS